MIIMMWWSIDLGMKTQFLHYDMDNTSVVVVEHKER